MSTYRSGAPIRAGTLRLQRRVAILAGAGTLAISLVPLAAAPASARTFDFNATGTMVQQPLPPQFACAMSRAIANRHIACH